MTVIGFWCGGCEFCLRREATVQGVGCYLFGDAVTCWLSRAVQSASRAGSDIVSSWLGSAGHKTGRVLFGACALCYIATGVSSDGQHLRRHYCVLEVVPGTASVSVHVEQWLSYTNQEPEKAVDRPGNAASNDCVLAYPFESV